MTQKQPGSSVGASGTAIAGGTKLEPMFTIYTKLFAEPANPDETKRVGEALAKFNPNDPESTRGEILGELKRLNNGNDTDLDDEFLESLQKVFAKTRPMSPDQTDKEAGDKARTFWKAAVGGSVTQFRDLAERIRQFKVSGKPQDREALIAELQKMVPDSEWSDRQIDDFVVLQVHSTDLQSLAWFDVLTDAW